MGGCTPQRCAGACGLQLCWLRGALHLSFLSEKQSGGGRGQSRPQSTQEVNNRRVGVQNEPCSVGTWLAVCLSPVWGWLHQHLAAFNILESHRPAWAALLLGASHCHPRNRGAAPPPKSSALSCPTALDGGSLSPLGPMGTFPKGLTSNVPRFEPRLGAGMMGRASPSSP